MQKTSPSAVAAVISSNGCIMHFHHEFTRRYLNETIETIGRYFDSLGLRSFRHFWPDYEDYCHDDAQSSTSNILATGLRARLRRTNSLLPSVGNPDPSVWENRSIVIHSRQYELAGHSGLDLIGSVSADLSGFVFCYCLTTNPEKENVARYTPLLASWVTVSEAEKYVDREWKGMVCWRHFSPEVQKEIQLAFLLRTLIESAWWAVKDDDKSSESQRIVSIPIPDLICFPIETIQILDELARERILCQHFSHGTYFAGAHQPGRCPCSKLATAPDDTQEEVRTYLLLPVTRLKAFISDLRRKYSRQRDATDPMCNVLTGRPSDQVKKEIDAARRNLQQLYARKDRIRKSVHHAQCQQSKKSKQQESQVPLDDHR